MRAVINSQLVRERLGKGAPEINSVRNAILLMIVEGVLTALVGVIRARLEHERKQQGLIRRREVNECARLCWWPPPLARCEYSKGLPLRVSPATQAAHNNIMALLTVISATSAQTCPPDARSVCPGKKGFFLCYFRSSF